MAPWHWYVCTTLLCGTRANPVLSQQYRVAAVEKSPEAIPRAGNTRVCQAVTLIQLFRDQARVLLHVALRITPFFGVVAKLSRLL